MMKRISFYLLLAFFSLAGLNHFLNPQFYLPLIPDYLPYPEAINWISGVLEMGLGLGLLMEKSRRAFALGLIILLVLFIPSHVYFIQIGSCIEGGLCVPEWLSWGRLIIIHPLIMWWIWIHRK